MSSSGRSRERGQILVIFTGGLIAILLVSALVIDLGFVFMVRRAEQNAIDPGAIAAARFIPTADVTSMRRAACFYARQNGFFPSATTDDGCIPANDPNGTVLTVNYPPSANAGTFAGSPGKVEVTIGRPQVSFLARIIGIVQFGVASSAVAAFDTGPSNISSLIALDPTSCDSGKTHGTGNINIHPVVPGTDGGYVHVNSTCSTGSPDNVCSSSSKGGLDVTGSGVITAPHTYVSGTCKLASGTLNSPLTEGAVQIGDPLADLKPPSFGIPNPGAECGVGTGKFTTPTGPGAGGCKWTSNATFNMLPGVYYGGWDVGSKVDLVLAPGIYIMAGGGIKLTAGGTISSVQGGSGTPAPVMFYNTDNPATGTGQAGLDFTATGDLRLHALTSGPYKGILIWNDGKGSNPTSLVTLGGQVNFDISGTIYNPKGSVTLEGGSGVGGGTINQASVQIIAWQFDVGGNATLDMPYDPNLLYQFPEKGLVR